MNISHLSQSSRHLALGMVVVVAAVVLVLVVLVGEGCVITN
jgi:hypothetical protein